MRVYLYLVLLTDDICSLVFVTKAHIIIVNLPVNLL